MNRRQSISAVLFSFLFFSAPTFGMHLESYWESWVLKDYPNDWCALLEEVPASPIGSTKGANYISIAFGDFSGGFGGIEVNESIVIDGIKAIHEKGGKAKVAYGGALYDMSSYIHNNADAEKFAMSIKELKEQHGLDGIDLDVESSGAKADIQIHLIKSLREECGPDFHITYTVPALTESVTPWMETMRDSIEYMDAINIMAYDVYWEGYDWMMDIAALEDLGVPRSKMVLGLMPGHHDAGNEYTSLEDAKKATRDAMELGLAGMMTWDINRDTDQRMNYPAGADNLYQTGQGKATYINAISSVINS